MMEMVMNRCGRTQLHRITKMKLPIALWHASLQVICNMPYGMFAPCLCVYICIYTPVYFTHIYIVFRHVLIYRIRSLLLMSH